MQEGPNSDRELLTASRLRAARACLRLDHLRYREGWEAVADENENTAFGSLMHAALEVWWRDGGKIDTSLPLALAAIDAASCDEFDRAKAKALMLGYDARWSGRSISVLHVEAEFRSRLQNPDTGAASRTFDVAGKVDAIVITGGKLFVVEHKTSSEDITPGSDYWARLNMDSQVSIYYDGASEIVGKRVEGVLYDVIGKRKLRPFKATPEDQRKFTKDGRLYANQRDADETPAEYERRLVEAIAAEPDRYYGRGTIVRLEKEMNEARADLWQIAQVMRSSAALGMYPRNPDACVRFGRTCEFFGVCTGQASLDDPSKFRRRDRLHSELTEVL